jgi:hypothetical protein
MFLHFARKTAAVDLSGERRRDPAFWYRYQNGKANDQYAEQHA